MSSDDVAIRVSGLSKRYEIYAKSSDRLKQFVLPRLHRLIGMKPRQYFREFWALKDVSFEVKRGETVGIIGRNGSGKSTLLQMICGTLSPTQGHIQTNGPIAALLELGSGFNPEFTGRENVYMNASVLGLNKQEIDVLFNDIVAFADIGEFVEQPVKTYSSGMVVRLAFAVIAHVAADVLIIDEALSVGDAHFNQKCIRFLKEFQEKGAILFVSHDTNAILNLCNRAALVENGRMLLQGSPKAICEEYFKTLFRPINNEIVSTEEKNKTAEERAAHTFIDQPKLETQLGMELIPPTPALQDGPTALVDISLTNMQRETITQIDHSQSVLLKAEYKNIGPEIKNPIIGFQIKDRLGQVIFADNTYLARHEELLSFGINERLVTTFQFRLPRLRQGPYSIDVALASGTQENHVMHHWGFDVCVFYVQSSEFRLGMIGLDELGIVTHIEPA